MDSDPELDRWFAAEVLPHERELRGWLRGQFRLLPELDDLVQEAYARILEVRRRAPDRIRAVKPFLFATARNLALDHVRHRHAAPFEDIAEPEVWAVVEDMPRISETVGQRQELELLVEAIQALPERCRQVLTLRKLYGVPQKEIAAELGISEHTVEAQVGLGLKRCAEYLARFGLP